jgi:hypothetical protein
MTYDGLADDRSGGPNEKKSSSCVETTFSHARDMGHLRAHD